MVGMQERLGGAANQNYMKNKFPIAIFHVKRPQQASPSLSLVLRRSSWIVLAHGGCPVLPRHLAGALSPFDLTNNPVHWYFYSYFTVRKVVLRDDLGRSVHFSDA